MSYQSMFRPGLFETQGISNWISWNCNSFFYEVLRPVSNYGLLILLIAGTAYHFTNRKWVEIHMRNAFHKLPGPVLGIVFGTTMLMIMHLLNGPRANIYFVF